MNYKPLAGFDSFVTLSSKRETLHLSYILYTEPTKTLGAKFKCSRPIQNKISVPFIPQKIVKMRFLLPCISFVSRLHYLDEICFFPSGRLHDRNFVVQFHAQWLSTSVFKRRSEGKNSASHLSSDTAYNHFPS